MHTVQWIQWFSVQPQSFKTRKNLEQFVPSQKRRPCTLELSSSSNPHIQCSPQESFSLNESACPGRLHLCEIIHVVFHAQFLSLVNALHKILFLFITGQYPYFMDDPHTTLHYAMKWFNLMNL